MKIKEITGFLETIAHPSLQENYDNAGLITGNPETTCSGVICALDATEVVVNEAIQKKCNLIIAHHPIVFVGLKKITGKNYVERTIIAAIKNDIAIYAIHTNLDNVLQGVNGKIASLFGLLNIAILLPKENTLKKLYTYVPENKAEQVRQAIFNAGGGQISSYSECSFNTKGEGTFKAGIDTSPYVGEIGKRHQENEIKIEAILPSFLENQVIAAMKAAHPYEEVAFEVIALSNKHPETGAGITGYLPEEMDEKEFLDKVKSVFKVPVVKHTRLTGKKVKKIAICGGAGNFLISKALATDSQAYITSDLKYHEYFDADNRILLIDVGHYESEQFTIDYLSEVLGKKFPNFAVLKTELITNPVHYFF
ncbi:MAG TPA: Nif3-like dinuclear metal center hexameric protein [Chitinophagaceae bacterium]|jgi:dinuclear metal center YbgI/SA1388 family protein|nr:Nif3-like dinuclear metal center hexameric protein [Chitinophagaceae bacterium]